MCETTAPLAVADVTAPVPPEEVLSQGQGWQELRAVRAGAGEALGDPAVPWLGATGWAAAGRAGQGTRGVAGPLLQGTAVGVWSRGRAGGQRGQRRELRGRAAVAPWAGLVSWAGRAGGQTLVEAELQRLEGVWGVVWGWLEGTEGWLWACVWLQTGIYQLLQVAGALLTGEAVGKLPGWAAVGNRRDGLCFQRF